MGESNNINNNNTTTPNSNHLVPGHPASSNGMMSSGVPPPPPPSAGSTTAGPSSTVVGGTSSNGVMNDGNDGSVPSGSSAVSLPLPPPPLPAVIPPPNPHNNNGNNHTNNPHVSSSSIMAGNTITKSTTNPNHANHDQIIACAQCHTKISDRYLLKAMDKYWHEDCLKCGCCGCRLAEAGSSMFFKQNMLLCKRDYLRLFGSTGLCAACHKSIPAFEMVMRARNNVYHLECFACQECNHRFCVGDRFYLCDNKILCEYDYEERLVFAQMAYNYNSLAQLKRQFQDEDISDPNQSVPNGLPVPTR